MVKKVATKEKANVKNVPSLIGAPRITEKAARLSEQNAYIFSVAQNATKPEIKKAFLAQYKKTPIKIAIIMKQQTKKLVRNRKIKVSGGKKAIVFLKKGETIEFA